jgi:hypothetical protein
MAHSTRRTWGPILVLGLLSLSSAPGWGQVAPEQKSSLDLKAFFNPQLYISTSHVPVESVMSELPNRASWEAFAQRSVAPGAMRAFLDPRSGVASGLVLSIPLIPGNGVGNRVTLREMGTRLGRPVQQVDADAVGSAVMGWVRSNQKLLGLDLAQLGKPRVTKITDNLWQFSAPQVVNGVEVLYGRLAASISHGNLVLVGAETWGNASVNTKPTLTAEQALDAGFAYANGRGATDMVLSQPRLQIVPFAPPKQQAGEVFAGSVGAGYGHHLVYVFTFRRDPELATWEVMVHAHTGEVLSFVDKNDYVTKQFTGGVYPLSDTGQCPDAQRCGAMQLGWPMPFANTGFASPNNFTNSAGNYNYTSGTATTSLNGQFVRIADNCGAISESSATGSINLGGANNQHDCTSGGASAGDTPAARSAFYEINKLKEQARGWLPNNSWLQAQLTANVNINSTCNAFWNGSTVNFYRSGAGCRNTGEIAAVFDHEWGHGLDDNDAAGTLSNSSEAYADITAIYRLQASCVGYGFFQTADQGCGQTADGTGFNSDESQVGASHCELNCSGVRGADWNQHADHQPDTALGFVCGSCTTGGGPCGREVHCAAAPVNQAAWDLATRDLTAAPFNLDSQSAFIVANRIFFQGSGNIGSWHACTCGSSSSGCGAANGYMQWLTADDDNGNLNDGTPHMTAIFNAFNRHGIACATPTATNSGCAAGPSTAPTLSATPGDSSVALSWNSVAGASRFEVFRSEGHAGCNFGKTRIADITGTSFNDTQVANGRLYSYNVVAQGTSPSCLSRASSCVQVTPQAGATPDFTVSASPSSVSVAQGGSANTTVTVGSVNGFNSAVSLAASGLPSGVTAAFSPASVTPPANGSANSTLTFSASATATAGTSSVTITGTSGATSHNTTVSLTVTGGGAVTVFFDNFETSLGWTRNPNGTDTATTGLWERGNPEPTSSGGVNLQVGTTTSGVNDLVTAAAAGASAGVNDVDGGTTSIQSPAITLPSTGTLTLSFSWYLAHLNNATNADFFRVSIVGSTTSVVFQQLGAAANRAGAFATASVNISSFAGQTVRILISAADAGTASLIEAGVDDVKITQQ